MIVAILLLIVLIAVSPDKTASGYEAFCQAECWSRRKPCCMVS